MAVATEGGAVPFAWTIVFVSINGALSSMHYRETAYELLLDEFERAIPQCFVILISPRSEPFEGSTWEPTRDIFDCGAQQKVSVLVAI